MDLRNCPQCGQIFNFIRTNLCPACQQKDEADFRKIRRYITQNPGVSAIEVSKNTGVSENKVLRFLREGRLATGAGPKANCGCELCGKPVFGSRYCSVCQEKLTMGFKKAVAEERKNEVQGPRMHTADLRRRHQK